MDAAAPGEDHFVGHEAARVARDRDQEDVQGLNESSVDQPVDLLRQQDRRQKEQRERRPGEPGGDEQPEAPEWSDGVKRSVRAALV